jgi:hypothetical protein
MRILVLFVITAVMALSQQMSLKTWDALSSTGVTAALATAGNDKHTVAAVVTGSPAACTVRLEGSVDGTNYFDLSGAQTCTSTTMFHVVDRVVVFVRVRVVTLSGGTAPTVTPTYLGIRSGGRQ